MFRYYAILTMEEPDAPPTGLIAREDSDGPLRTVMWNHRSRAWTCEPETAALFLYDQRYQSRRTAVERSRAEEIVRTLGTELPTEDELHRICEAGVTAT
jgi:hypothetical protein